MGTSAAMVQLKVVLAGGGGAISDADCATIFACFDPPIRMGPHEDMGSTREWQAEHVPPCSNMHVKGRDGPRIDGCTNYDTDKAMTWIVEDGQSLDTEHQRLTKAMREFSQANEASKKNATLKEWMDQYEPEAKKVLEDRKVTDDAKELDKSALSAAAAKCIRQKVDASYQGKVAQSTPLRNGQAQGLPPKKPMRGGSGSAGGF